MEKIHIHKYILNIWKKRILQDTRTQIASLISGKFELCEFEILKLWLAFGVNLEVKILCVLTEK